MGRPPKDPNQIKVDKNQLADIMARLDAAEAKNVELENKVAKNAKGGIETSAHRLLNKPIEREQDPQEVRKSINVVDKKATIDDVMMYDNCPFCKKYHASLPTILDKTNADKYACRRCGKHWFKWALEPSPFTGKIYQYSEDLEKGERKRVEMAERIQMGQAGLAVGIIEGSEDN